MQDRSSAPHRAPARVVKTIERLRRLRWTCAGIDAELGLATSMACAVFYR
jgi:hypothetical protein